MNNKNNFDDTPLTDLDYKGVIYEPSENARNFQKKHNSFNIKKDIKEPKKKIKKASSFNFNLFLGLTISLALFAFVMALSLTYSSVASYFNFPTFSEDNNVNANLNLSENSNLNDNENNPILDSNTHKNMLGIIKNIDYDKNLIDIINMSTNKIYTLKTKPSSIFKDKYDNMLSLSELSSGLIVDFSFDDNNKINYINENKDSFILKDISNLKIDLANKTLGLNDKIFTIDDKVTVLKNNQPYDLSKILSFDVVDIKGYKDNVYYIDIKKGTGTLKIINKPDLTNGVLEIGRHTFIPLNDGSDVVSLPEGVHKIVVRSSDSVSFAKEINITSDAETILDLSQIQNKLSTIFVKSNVTDYTLYINDEIKNISEPLKLPYGTYNVKAEKEGYLPFQQQISINSERYNLNIDFEKIEKLGKISVSSSPENANVFVDNTLVGQTPLSYKIPQGVHTITLKKEGYNDFVLSSVTIGDEESSFNITMHKAQNSSDTSSTTTTTTPSSSTTETTLSQPTI